MNRVAAFPSTPVYELATTGRPGSLERQRRQVILWLTGAFWGLHTLALWTADALAHHPHLLRATAVRLMLMAVGLALCLGLHMILPQLRRRAWRPTAPIVFVASLVAAALIGRASCRDSVCMSVEISGGDASFKTKHCA